MCSILNLGSGNVNNTFRVENLEIPYEIVVNKRLKHMRISMDMEGMRVSVPRKVNLVEIEKLLTSKSKWIYEHYTKLQAMKTPEKEWDKNEEILYLGQPYCVSIHCYDAERRARALFDGEEFKVYINREFSKDERKKVIKEALRSLYKSMADKIVNERLLYYSKIIGVSYNDVRIKEQKTRWGSCSKKGNLNFNWKIIMAPQWVMDYVVIHELCHLKHLNHSKEYWAMVSCYMPDYNSARQWLKENGMKLGI